MANYIFKSKINKPEFDIIIAGFTIQFAFKYNEATFQAIYDHNKYTFKNILPGIDVVYYLSEDSIKEYILIWNTSHIEEDIEFTVSSPDNIIFYTTPEGEMQFRALNGTHLITLNKMKMTNSSGKELGDVFLKHRQGGGKYTFTIILDRDNIENKNYDLPIVIDPPITFGPEEHLEAITSSPRVFSDIPYGGRAPGDSKFSLKIFQDNGPYPVHTWKGTPVVGTVPMYADLVRNDASKQDAFINGYGLESWTISIEFICNKVLGIPGAAPKVYYSVDSLITVGVHSHNNEAVFVGNINGSSVYRGTFTIHKESYPSYVDGEHVISIRTLKSEVYHLPLQVTVEAPELASFKIYLRVGGIYGWTMVDPSSTARWVANDASGLVYSLNSWNLAAQHPCTNSNTIVVTKTGWAFSDNSTLIRARVYGGSGTATVLAQNQRTVSGNIDNTTDGIRIQVTNWLDIGGSYTGAVTITYNLATVASTNALFTNGGRFYIEARHYDGEHEYRYSSRTSMSDDLFYDNSVSAQTITGITTAHFNVVGKYISGVLYYTIGDVLTIGITDMDYLNANSYPTTLATMDSDDFGITNYNIISSDLTGWTNAYNNTNASYSASKTISRVNYQLVGSAVIQGQVFDWVAGATSNTTKSICIDTYSTTATGQTEYFRNEAYRCPAAGNFDTSTANTWTSSSVLGAGDAQFTLGTCKYPSVNYAAYDPGVTVGAGNPNYSAGFNPTVYLYRKFTHPSGVVGCSSGRLSITVQAGSVLTLELKTAAVHDGTANGGTQWTNMLAVFNAGTWSYGDTGQGCSADSPPSGTGVGAHTYNWTIGGNNLANSSGTLYIKIGLQSGAIINAMSMTFN